MKAHTNNFKTNISLHGRELDSKITYELDGETVELGVEELNSISPHYEGNILKSVMKQLDIDSNVDIPLNTIINYQFGVKVGNSYEYLDFGNYIVYSSEKQEATNSYLIIAYDKMLYSMKDYESLGVTYPITIRNYITALCNKLGLNFANGNDNFPNYNRQIYGELYLDNQGNSMDYTYRDVLDELAQVTGSTICLNANEELEIRYITETNDIIDENYFKDTNVNFGEKYGPINSIVLSRSGGADNVYIQDAQSIAQNGLCEVKISDNQIMNWNDRSDYLPDLLSALGGLEYYINDYTSTGVMYYDLCDRYTAKIGENNYSCVMFNDEPRITQGLQEQIYTNRPDVSETDYTKADKTDRRINQTYLIVDKQNQEISSVITNVDTQNTKIANLTQRVGQLESEISEISDITISGETQIAQFQLDNINESEPVSVKVFPINENIAYLYPQSTLYPSENLFMKQRLVMFHNITTNEDFPCEIPEDLLVYDNEHYDEFEMQYGDGSPETQVCRVTKRCKYNNDGTVGLLEEEETHIYSYPQVLLTDGDYIVSIYGYNSGYLFARLMTKNIYTSQFYTKVETNSLINQTASSIDLSVDQKLSNYSTTTEMNSAISIKANEINSSVSETYTTKTQTAQAKSEAIASANSDTDEKLEDYSTTTQMTSAINQKASEITSTVSQTYETKTHANTTTNTLSSRISQTATAIDLSVSNGSTASGITITTTKEDGTTSQTTGTIQMNGLVSFTNLSTSGQTQINGGNITTGTISANRLSSSVITTSNLSAQSLSANQISGGTIKGIAFNNGSGTFTVNSNGKIYAKSGTIGGWSLSSEKMYGKATHGGTEKTWSIRPYGIANDTDGVSYYWGNVVSFSDERLKRDIKNIENKFEYFFDNLKPKTFRFKELDDGRKHIGFIAQDIVENEQNINEDFAMVDTSPEGYYNLKKDEIIALNTWQIQKLKQENKELKSAIDELRQEIEKLKKGR